MEVRSLGNICKPNWGTGFPGNVWDKEMLSPTLSTMQGGYREPMIIDENIVIGGMQKHQAIKKDGICTTLTSSMGTGGGYVPMVLSDKSIVAMRGRNPENPSDRTVGSPTEQRLEANSQGICNTLTSVQKDNLVMEKVLGVTLFESDNFGGWKVNKEELSPTIRAEKVCAGALETVKIKQATKDGYVECKIGGVADLSFPSSTTRRGRVQDNGDTCPTLMAGEQDICRIESVCAIDEQNMNVRNETFGTLTTDGSSPKHNNRVMEYTETQYRIRKLTPMECWRLMDFTDEDFYKAEEVNSNTQLYKQAGNSICKNVLVAIFGQMLPDKENVYMEVK